MSLRFIITFILLLAPCARSVARADHEIVWRPLGGATEPTTAEDRRRASELARESIALLDQHDLAGAEAKLRTALAIMPEKAVWHFNLACILTARGQTDAAMASLEKAAECGFTDFTLLEHDPALVPLHDLPRYVRLLARKDEICHKAARRALDDLQQYLGDSYLYEVDQEHKLVFAASTDRATLDELKTWLTDQARSQGDLLFLHKPDEFIRVVLPSRADYRRMIRRPGVRGIYEDETRTLFVDGLGQVMTHEFTHALHSADQRAVGQEHPIWLREGLASMFEAAAFENGQLIPCDNFRLGFVQAAVRHNGAIPLDKLLKLQPTDFLRGPNLAYGQTSSLLLYLYEQKLLRKFYDSYKTTYAKDATGQIALESVTGKTLAELNKDWCKWVLARKSPMLASGPGGPYLGVHFGQAVDGLKVSMVLPAGPAAKAGVKDGDVIVAFDNHEVRDYASLSPLLAQHKPGDQVTLKVRRDGNYMEIPLVLEKS